MAWLIASQSLGGRPSSPRTRAIPAQAVLVEPMIGDLPIIGPIPLPTPMDIVPPTVGNPDVVSPRTPTANRQPRSRKAEMCGRMGKGNRILLRSQKTGFAWREWVSRIWKESKPVHSRNDFGGMRRQPNCVIEVRICSRGKGRGKERRCQTPTPL
jgi:hypothetical protein